MIEQINNIAGTSQENENKPKDIRADADMRNRLEEFNRYLSQNWLRFFALIATGTLTWIAGWTLTHNPFYTVLLVGLAEGASLFWTARTEDNGNPTQERIAVAGMIFSWAAIIATDLSSATIIANMANQSGVKVFTLFETVPALAQQVVTYVIPALAVIHGILGTAHYSFSEDAKLKRDIAKTDREARKAIAQAEADARKNIAKAKADRFKQIAEQQAAGIGVAEGETLWQKTYQNKAVADAMAFASETDGAGQLKAVKQSKKSKTGSNGHSGDSNLDDSNP